MVGEHITDATTTGSNYTSRVAEPVWQDRAYGYQVGTLDDARGGVPQGHRPDRGMGRGRPRCALTNSFHGKGWPEGKSNDFNAPKGRKGGRAGLGKL